LTKAHPQTTQQAPKKQVKELDEEDKAFLEKKRACTSTTPQPLSPSESSCNPNTNGSKKKIDEKQKAELAAKAAGKGPLVSSHAIPFSPLLLAPTIFMSLSLSLSLSMSLCLSANIYCPPSLLSTNKQSTGAQGIKKSGKK
jgi:hypothetical protein